jgi:signal transduction histidine kinase
MTATGEVTSPGSGGALQPRRRLVVKLLVSVILMELIIMPIVGLVYFTRFARQIDGRYAERLETATALIANSRLNLTSLTDRETMSVLLGADLVDAMVITDQKLIAFSLNPAYRRQSTDVVDFLKDIAFDHDNTRPSLKRISVGGQSFLVSMAALRGPGEHRVSSFLYFRVSEASAEREKAQVAVLLVLGLALTAMATSLALVIISDRTILTRIARLADGLTRVQSGDLTVRTSSSDARPRHPDEIDVLGHGFDSMVEHLQMLVGELEQRVADRTRDLALAKEMAESAQQRAEAAAAAKTTFLSMMSHDLRSPLNGILGFAQILQLEKGMSERSLSGLNIIRQSGDHLLALINDILDMSKAEAGRMELFPEPVALPEFLRVLTAIIRVRAEQKNLAFTVDIDPALPQRVLLDAKRMRQILLNLLSNAVQYTDRGEVTFRVTQMARSGDQATLRFEVIDSGIGMSEAQQNRLFRPFEQGGSAKHRSGGTGLGLVIASQLVQAMDSAFQVESAAGEGSRFRFDVLLTWVPAKADAVVLEERAVIGYEGRRRRVLVVDDMPANLNFLADLFTSLGFEVDNAVNGEQGLARAMAHPPDLVVMDVSMPGMDGAEATRRLKAVPGLASVPVVAVTANPSGEERSRMMSAGANAFLPKPIDPSALLAEVERLLALAWVVDTP